MYNDAPESHVLHAWHVASDVAVALTDTYCPVEHAVTSSHTVFCDGVHANSAYSPVEQVAHVVHLRSAVAAHGVCSYVDPVTQAVHDEHTASAEAEHFAL